MAIENIVSPMELKLHLSNGYPVDFDRLSRLLNASCTDMRKRIPQSELATTVGVANKHIKSLSGILQSLGLVERSTYKATSFGLLIHKYDPFFDDLGTLWFIHYRLSSDPRLVVWNRMINQLIPTQKAITRDKAIDALLDVSQWFKNASIRSHIQKELNAFFDAYTHQRLSRVDYLRAEDDQYILGHREAVPALVLAASITDFRDRHRLGATAVNVAELLVESNSPGVVFQMSEDYFRDVLEALKNQPGVSLESRADLDQIRLADGMTSMEWMRRHYETR